MKRYILGFLLSIIFSMAFSVDALGQRRMDEERIKIFKQKFFNEELALTESEKEAFWPLYNKYESDKRALKKKMIKGKNVAVIPDTELNGFILTHLEFEQKQLDLKKEFFKKAETILPIRKVATIPSTEQKFKKKILEEMRRRRQERRGQMGNE